MEADHRALTDHRQCQDHEGEEAIGPDHDHQDVISEVAEEVEEEADVVVEGGHEMIMADTARSVHIRGQDLGPRGGVAQGHTHHVPFRVRFLEPLRGDRVVVVVVLVEDATLRRGVDVAMRTEVVAAGARATTLTRVIAIAVEAENVVGVEGTEDRLPNLYTWSISLSTIFIITGVTIKMGIPFAHSPRSMKTE